MILKIHRPILIVLYILCLSSIEIEASKSYRVFLARSVIFCRLRTLKGVFSDLGALEELLLNDNLLLQLSNDWFSKTPNLRTVHLENNVIFEIKEGALQPLKRLTKLYLSSNFISEVTSSCFRYNVAMTSLALDNNHIR